METLSLWRRSAAECLGVFALVTGGCGAIAVNQATGALGHVGVSASFGLVIMVMIAAVGHLSGAHFNPAVTVAFAVTRHFPWRDVPLYVVGQLLGAVGGALVLRAFFGSEAGLGVTVPWGSPLRALGMEVLLTAVLMFVITSVATDTSRRAARRHRYRRHGCARCALGRADHRRLHEPGSLFGTRAGGWSVAGSVDLLARSMGGGDSRSLPISGAPFGVSRQGLR